MGAVTNCVMGLEDEDVEIVIEEKEEDKEEVVREGVAAPVVTLMYRELKRTCWLEELFNIARKKMSLRCRFCDGRPSQ